HQEAVNFIEHPRKGVVVSTAGTVSNRSRGGRPSSYNVITIEPQSITVVTVVDAVRAVQHGRAGGAAQRDRATGAATPGCRPDPSEAAVGPVARRRRCDHQRAADEACGIQCDAVRRRAWRREDPAVATNEEPAGPLYGCGRRSAGGDRDVVEAYRAGFVGRRSAHAGA